MGLNVIHDFLLETRVASLTAKNLSFRRGYSLSEKLNQDEKCDMDIYTALIKRLEVFTNSNRPETSCYDKIYLSVFFWL